MGTYPCLCSKYGLGSKTRLQRGQLCSCGHMPLTHSLYKLVAPSRCAHAFFCPTSARPPHKPRFAVLEPPLLRHCCSCSCPPPCLDRPLSIWGGTGTNYVPGFTTTVVSIVGASSGESCCECARNGLVSCASTYPGGKHTRVANPSPLHTSKLCAMVRTHLRLSRPPFIRRLTSRPPKIAVRAAEVGGNHRGPPPGCIEPKMARSTQPVTPS